MTVAERQAFAARYAREKCRPDQRVGGNSSLLAIASQDQVTSYIDGQCASKNQATR